MLLNFRLGVCLIMKSMTFEESQLYGTKLSDVVKGNVLAKRR